MICLGERHRKKAADGTWETTSEKVVPLDSLDRFGETVNPIKAEKPAKVKEDKPDVIKDEDDWTVHPAIMIGKWSVELRTKLLLFSYDAPRPNSKTGKMEKGAAMMRRKLHLSHEAWPKGTAIVVKASRGKAKSGEEKGPIGYTMTFPGAKPGKRMEQTLAGKTFGERFGIETALHIMSLLG